MSAAKLILGTVQFGLNYGIANQEGKPALEKVREILFQAADCGITMLDTAAAYGDSEKVIGSILKDEPALRKNFRIVSKVSPVPQGITGKEAEKFIRDSVLTSLKNLQIPRLHAILFHREADHIHLPVLQELQQEGLVEMYGFSADGAIPENLPQVGMIQIPANVLDRRFLPWKNAVKPEKLVIRSVYLQGLLLMPVNNIPPHLTETVKYRRELEMLAAEAGITPAELFVRYLFSFAEADGILTGVDNAAQLKYNAALAEKGALPEDLFRQITGIVPELPERLIRPSLWNKC